MAETAVPGVDPRAVVLDFYREALLSRRPAAAFTRFMAPNFVEHKPDVEKGTREGAAEFLELLMSSLPEAQWEVLRTVAEGNFVFVHAKFTPHVGAEPFAIADLFRVQADKIVEHWDVVAGPPQRQSNPNARF